MAHIRLYIIFVLLCFMQACKNDDNSNHADFHSSFESVNDTAGWIGILPSMFVKEEDKDFIHLKSSDSRPAATLELNIISEGNYKLECTGKTNTNGGYICMKNSPLINSDARCIYVNNNEWTKYSSSEIFCPANSHVVIEIFAGGEIPSDLYLDEITLTR